MGVKGLLVWAQRLTLRGGDNDVAPAKVEEWTARADLRHRVWALRASIERYLRLQQEQIASIREAPPRNGYTLSQQKLNSETDIHIEAVLTNAKHLSRALQSKHLPASIKGQSRRSRANRSA